MSALVPKDHRMCPGKVDCPRSPSCSYIPDVGLSKRGPAPGDSESPPFFQDLAPCVPSVRADPDVYLGSPQKWLRVALSCVSRPREWGPSQEPGEAQTCPRLGGRETLEVGMKRYLFSRGQT